MCGYAIGMVFAGDAGATDLLVMLILLVLIMLVLTLHYKT